MSRFLWFSVYIGYCYVNASCAVWSWYWVLSILVSVCVCFSSWTTTDQRM